MDKNAIEFIDGYKKDNEIYNPGGKMILFDSPVTLVIHYKTNFIHANGSRCLDMEQMYH